PHSRFIASTGEPWAARTVQVRDPLLTSESSHTTFESVTLTQDLKHPNLVSDFLRHGMVALEPHRTAWPAQCTRHPELGAVEDGDARDAAVSAGRSTSASSTSSMGMRPPTAS